MVETHRKILRSIEQKTPTDKQLSKAVKSIGQRYLTRASAHFHKRFRQSPDKEGPDQTHREDSQELWGLAEEQVEG